MSLGSGQICLNLSFRSVSIRFGWRSLFCQESLNLSALARKGSKDPLTSKSIGAILSTEPDRAKEPLMTKCYKCESTSVIQDGQIWTCWEHIKACDCTKSHNRGNEWEYSGVYPSIPITVEAMEFQAVEEKTSL